MPKNLLLIKKLTVKKASAFIKRSQSIIELANRLQNERLQGHLPTAHRQSLLGALSLGDQYILPKSQSANSGKT